MVEYETLPQPATLDAAMAAHGITLESVFIPWSQSRNAGQTDERGRPVYSLNWRVTVKRDGREILTTDYSAGIGHCPSYRQSFGRQTIAERDQMAWECENGFAASLYGSGTSYRKPGSRPILPKPADVLHALLSDSDVIDHPTFESWAGDLGFDPDSRKAESIYRACMETALRLRNGLGESVLAELRNASQDY